MHHFMEKRRFFVQYVSQEDFRKFLHDRQPLDMRDSLRMQIEPVEYYDSQAIRCKVIQFIPDSTIGGEDHWEYLSKHSYRNNDYLIKYSEGKEIYFTSDGVSFFRLLNVRITEDNFNLEFNLRLIEVLQHIEVGRGFMIMPFRDKNLSSFYRNSIQQFLKSKLRIDIYRADDFNDTDVIIDTIYKEIEKAEFVICEITECNKNVFFEIGYAKALNKELIFLLRRGIEHKFFDVAHIRRIDYDLDNPEELQERLYDTILSIRKRR